MKHFSDRCLFAAWVLALATVSIVNGRACATTLGDEGTPTEATLVAAAVDTTHRTSLSTPPTPGARPTNVPLPNPMNSGLTDSQARMQADVATETARLTQAATQDETKLVDRLANEFGMTSRALTSEQRTLDASWGDLLLAHTLAANSDGNATVQRLIELRTRGSSWASIAGDMGFALDEVVAAMRQETQVATGVVRGDGKLATLARGNASTSTSVEKTRTGAKIIRGSGAEPAKTTTEEAGK